MHPALRYGHWRITEHISVTSHSHAPSFTFYCYFSCASFHALHAKEKMFVLSALNHTKGAKVHLTMQMGSIRSLAISFCSVGVCLLLPFSLLLSLLLLFLFYLPFSVNPGTQYHRPQSTRLFLIVFSFSISINDGFDRPMDHNPPNFVMLHEHLENMARTKGRWTGKLIAGIGEKA